jgi:hypothetical protein
MWLCSRQPHLAIYLNKYDLGPLGAVFIATAFGMAELAHRRIASRPAIAPDAVQRL